MNHSSNNNHVDAMDERVASLRDDMPSPDVESRLQQGMQQHWHSLEDQPARVGAWSQWLPSTTTRLVGACSAAVVVIVAASLLLNTLLNPPSLYAQAIAAVRAAKTVHATGGRYKDGEQTEIFEIWYDAERGVHEQHTREGETSFRLDNGAFEWTYRASPNTIIKKLSRDPVGEIDDVLRPLEEIDKIGAKRMPDLDATIHGMSCRAFVAKMDQFTRPMRYRLWLDERDRLIRFEEQVKIDGKWTLDERADVRYDVPIPDERFLVSFPVGARIFDRTDPASPSNAPSLSDSLATAERLGIVLAIHEVRRVDDDTVFVMSTSRASQKVIDRFGQIDSQRSGGDKVYGEFTWGTNGRRLPDHSVLNGMEPIRLARWKNDGIAYQWVILKKRETTDLWIGSDGSLPVGFYVHTRNEWQKALKAAGEKWWLQGEKDVVTLDVPVEAEGLEAILADVHEQTLAIFGSTTRQPPLLNLKSIPYSKQDIEKAVASGTPRSQAERRLHGRSSAPQNISLDEWLKEVREMIAD